MAHRSSRSNQRIPNRHSAFRSDRHSSVQGEHGDGTEDQTISINRPRIFISAEPDKEDFFPGEVLVAEYRVELPFEEKPTAVESSVIWSSTGKGESDFGVHFFERRPKSFLNADQLRLPHRISTVLPQSPLSYDGSIIKINWSIRVRVFAGENQFSEDRFFRLGMTNTSEYEIMDVRRNDE